MHRSLSGKTHRARYRKTNKGRTIIKICIYSKTPLAAAPWELFKALRKYTLHDVSLINGKHRYADGRIFPYDLIWSINNEVAIRKLGDAEIWHIHNYLPPEIRDRKAHQKVLAQFHSLPRLGNWRELMKFADTRYTIKQPLQEKEYKLPSLPNIIDPDEYLPTKRSNKIKIAFAPTTRVAYGNINSKAYREVKASLNDIARKRTVDIQWIEGVPYKQNLAMKRESHILIDDIATGNWHRTTLEGACFGCAVLNRVNKIPFVFATPKTLEERLLWLIDNPGILKEYQHLTRLWVLQEWHAIDMVRHYVKAYEKTLGKRI